MAHMKRDRTHSFGYTTETVDTGFRTQSTEPTTESCGMITVSAGDEGGDGDDGADGDDGDTNGDDGTDGDGGDTNGDDGTDDTEQPSESVVPEGVPYLGGRAYSDPRVVGSAAGAGLLLFVATQSD